MAKVDVHYKLDYKGVGLMLNSESMRQSMERVAYEIKARAEAIAPVSDYRWNKTRGRYKASFHVTSRRYGGVKNDRASARVYNSAPEAVWVEFGNRGGEPYHVLARAAFAGHRRTI